MRLSILVLLLAAGALSAVAQSSPSARYRIGARDQLNIRIQELPSLTASHEVADDGTITLDIVGNLQLTGLTEIQAAERIRQRLLAEGLREATVSVAVTSYRSRPVAVMGAVGEAGNHVVPGRANLLEMLLTAGGLTPDHGPLVHVRRRADNGLTDQVEIPIQRLVELGDPQYNIPIFAGDLINVPVARKITIHFLGQFRNVGSLEFDASHGVTVLAAIAGAGGLTETAAKKISIKRRTESGDREEIEVDYRRLLAGRATDIPLQDGDLLVVEESFF